jgi:hypothetical protein
MVGDGMKKPPARRCRAGGLLPLAAPLFWTIRNAPRRYAVRGLFPLMQEEVLRFLAVGSAVQEVGERQDRRMFREWEKPNPPDWRIWHWGEKEVNLRTSIMATCLARLAAPSPRSG